MEKLAFQGAEDLNEEQTQSLFRNSYYELARRSTPASIAYIAAMLVFYHTTPYALDHAEVFFASFAIFIVCALLRLLLLSRFEQVYSYGPRFWMNLKMMAVLGASLTWGVFSSLVIYQYGASWSALITIAITLGLCAGSMHSVGMSLRMVNSYLITMMVPNIVAAIFMGGQAGTGLSVLFIVFMLYCMAQVRNINREYWEARINGVRLDNKTRKRLHELTYHDNLTGLPNRDLFNDRLQQALHSAKRNHRNLGVMVLGIDRLKKYSDTLGHDAGDKVLLEFSRLLKRTFREGDSVARINNDTFAIFTPNLEQVRDVATIANKLLTNLDKPIELAGLELTVTASMGISVYPLDGIEPKLLLKNAEVAKSRVREIGGNGYQFYETDMNLQAVARLKLETRLRHALEKNEFRLVYQPKVDMESGKLSGFEALLRWLPEDMDPVSPAVFIPILEDTGLIAPVGEWVLRQACQQNREWQNAGYPAMRIAVNLSVRQFREEGLADSIKNILAETGLDARYLELEITESMLIDHGEKTDKTLRTISNMGVHLSIDDFGTGYSSLAYLKKLPIDTLKIDRSFVKDITKDPNDAAVVQAVIAMAHNLNLRVVAEGAETAEQVIFLRNQLCDDMQGFYSSPPMDVLHATQFLVRGHCSKMMKLIQTGRIASSAG